MLCYGRVGARDEFGADGDLGGQTDDGGSDMGLREGVDGHVDVAWVGGVEGAEDEEDLTRAVAWGVEQGGSGHFESVFERGVAFGFEAGAAVLSWTDFANGGQVRGGVAGHVADGDSDAIVHTDDAKLGDGVLLEEFIDEGGDVLERENVAGGTVVFVVHGYGHVEDDDEVTDDASL